MNYSQNITMPAQSKKSAAPAKWLVQRSEPSQSRYARQLPRRGSQRIFTRKCMVSYYFTRSLCCLALRERWHPAGMTERVKFSWLPYYRPCSFASQPFDWFAVFSVSCLLYTSPSPRDKRHFRIAASPRGEVLRLGNDSMFPRFFVEICQVL